MSVRVESSETPVGRRADGTPWTLRFVEVAGSAPGPTTAFVAGVFGDKPLGTMTLWALARRLEEVGDLAGTVILCPAANPPALEVGTRVSPDHLYLNRVFPGAPTGFLTHQIAHALLDRLLERTDHVVDLHSGSPTMALWYTYDYGDLEFSASFGYLPVVTRFAQPGQLSKAVVDAGGKSMLVEFGGGALSDPSVGVEGCLNVLRYRGQLAGLPTGPKTVPLVEGDVSLFLPSTVGVLGSTYETAHVGRQVEPGVVAWVDSPGTGERLEEFAIDREGGLLLLANISPAVVAPGAFASAVAFPSREIGVPGA
jgi:predicted deacylase